jgi:antitoxin YefM
VKTVSAAAARKALERLLAEVSQTGEPIRIAGHGVSAVLAAEKDWRALKETVHLTSISGLIESIHEGLETPLAESLNSGVLRLCAHYE